MPTSLPIRRVLALVTVPILAAAGLVLASPAMASAPTGGSADPDPNPPAPSTETTIVDMIDASGLYGGTVASATAETPYPSTGLQDQRSVSTALMVLDDPGTAPQEDFLAYCIDLDEDTTIGIHYELGTWSDSNVPNLPYVEWILDNYFPKVPTAPTGTASEQVRAVQGAIWYFTDQFVVSRFYPAERNAVRAIVEAAQAAVDGSSPTPPPLPTLTIDPATIAGGISGDLVGPYTVGGDAGPATIEIAGTDVYRDAAGTIPVVDGDAVNAGDQLWARYDAGTSGQGFALTAYATVQAGNVYLYDGANPPRTSAQALVLATETVVPVRVAATITPSLAATLIVDVVVTGAAAGEQDQIEVRARCIDPDLPTPVEFVRDVPAGAAADTYSFTFPGIPSDATTCEVEQLQDGSNATVTASTTIVPASVVLDPATPQTITVTDAYTRIPGDFHVDVTIAGAAAGLQGDVVLDAACDTGAGIVSATFTVPAGTPAGTSTAGTITGVPNGSSCHTTVTADGADADAELVSSTVDPLVVTVPANGTAVTTATNTYAVPAPPSGRFAVDVTVAGAAAGRQAQIAVTASCDSGTSAAFTLPAGALAGTYRLGTIGDLPDGDECTATQTADGADADAVLSSATIIPASVVIASGATAVITVTDTYDAPTPPSGVFRVDVTIGGAAAGDQSGIAVAASCVDGPEEIGASFTVPAGAAAGSYAAGTIPEVPVGYECTATLTADGANADAELTSSTVSPASVVIANATTSVITVATVYAVPVPTPTPTPSPSPSPTTLAATGPSGSPPLGLGLAAGLVLVGGVVVGIAASRRRAR